MAEKLVRVVKNGIVLFESHIADGTKIKTVDEDDGVTTTLSILDPNDVSPAMADSQLEAQIPVPHALTTSDVKELNSPVTHDSKPPKEPDEPVDLDNTGDRGQAMVGGFDKSLNDEPVAEKNRKAAKRRTSSK